MPRLVCVLAALFAESPQNPGLSVQLEYASWKVQIVDPWFVRLSIVNTTDEELQVPYSLLHSVRYSIRWAKDSSYSYSYQFPPEPEQFSSTSRQIHPLAPGERWIIDYEVLETPPLKELQHEFWREVVGTRDIYMEPRIWSRSAELRELLPGCASFSAPSIRLRPPAEMQWLTELLAEWAKRTAANQPETGWEALGSRPLDFGLYSFRPYPDLVRKLVADEDALSSGSLRDIVRLVRLTQTIYHAPGESQETVDELLQWLDTLPEIERHCLGMRIVSWASMSGHNTPAFYTLVYGAVQRLPQRLYEFEDYRAYRLQQYASNHPGFEAWLDRGDGSDLHESPTEAR
jgi:hypothetical protein